MSFVADSRHFTFSSAKAIAHDEATATYTFEAASLFSGSSPASAVYATLACESFSCINGFYTVTSKNNCITVDGFSQVFIAPGFYNCANLAIAVQALIRPILGANFIFNDDRTDDDGDELGQQLHRVRRAFDNGGQIAGHGGGPHLLRF